MTEFMLDDEVSFKAMTGQPSSGTVYRIDADNRILMVSVGGGKFLTMYWSEATVTRRSREAEVERLTRKANAHQKLADEFRKQAEAATEIVSLPPD
jgi:hypothetical protein